MTLIDVPAHSDTLPDQQDSATPRMHRAENGLTSVIVLSNGAEVPLDGWVGSVTFPPNYLVDLRTGQL
jgi:hypothetical protein